MRPQDIWTIFEVHFKDVVGGVRTYVKENGANRIRLIFKDGRVGIFEIQRGKYVLEIKEAK